ncbi:MAG: ribonuclease HI family protein [Candidatus Shapirobacteria bacterium]|nr:ribonuclease HI family protein [Candidatus Shapirobacteria bacterium]
MFINVYTDGGSRGNPGISGYGLVIYDHQNKILYKEGKFLGIKTNNEAEYSGILAALSWIKNHKDLYQISQVNFFADSQLMIRQLQGIYKVKAPTLLPLYAQVQQLLTQISLPTKYTDVRREFNKLADELANQAMDKRF